MQTWFRFSKDRFNLSPCTGSKCTEAECCEPISCANNDNQDRIYTSTGFKRVTCGVGKVLKTRIQNGTRSNTALSYNIQVLKTQGGPNGPFGTYPAVFEDPPPCTGGNNCTIEDCCVAATCANNDGIANALAEDGFQEHSCGPNKVLKSRVDSPQAQTPCPSGRACTVDECCELMKCTNNLGTPNHHVRKEADGWGWRDVCLTGTQPFQPAVMPTKKCSSGKTNCTLGDCCEPITCANNNGARKTSVDGNGSGPTTAGSGATNKSDATGGFERLSCGAGWVRKVLKATLKNLNFNLMILRR